MDSLQRENKKLKEKVLSLERKLNECLNTGLLTFLDKFVEKSGKSQEESPEINPLTGEIYENEDKLERAKEVKEETIRRKKAKEEAKRKYEEWKEKLNKYYKLYGYERFVEELKNKTFGSLDERSNHWDEAESEEHQEDKDK